MNPFTMQGMESVQCQGGHGQQVVAFKGYTEVMQVMDGPHWGK